MQFETSLWMRCWRDRILFVDHASDLCGLCLWYLWITLWIFVDHSVSFRFEGPLRFQKWISAFLEHPYLETVSVSKNGWRDFRYARFWRQICPQKWIHRMGANVAQWNSKGARPPLTPAHLSHPARHPPAMACLRGCLPYITYTIAS